MIVAAYGGFELGTGLPRVAWPIQFDGEETFRWPPRAFSLDESKPHLILWQGTGAEYDAECARERPAFACRIEFWLHGEEGLSEEARREWQAFKEETKGSS